MPIYEYACRTCTHRFETIQKAAEEPLRDCPECGEPALKKLLSAPVFRLKGGGWYETDFKTGDKRNVVESGDGKKDGDANGGGGGGEEGKKDASATGESKTKPAAGGDAAAATKESAKSDGKSGATGGKTDAPREKPKGGPKPSG